jgi:ribulose-phosphate 3-epimerase
MTAVATAAAPSTLDRLLAGGPRLSIGMLTADLGRLNEDLALVEGEGAELVHVDVMDGVFVPPLTLGAPVVRAMRTSMLIDVHLMVEDPLSKVEAFVEAGAGMITFHVESARQPHRVLRALQTHRDTDGPLRGIALTPSTPVDAIEPLMDELEYVLLLAIDPGWSGQSFLSGTGARVERARDLIEASGRQVLVGIDGGVTRDNLDDVLALGPDIVVTGSAVFDGRDPASNARSLLARAAGAAAQRAASAAAQRAGGSART